MWTLRRPAVAALTALWLFEGALAAEQAQPQTAQQAPQGQTAKDLFPAAQIEQLAAPIALYPDALLAQILMASTYPLDIVQAARWQEKNKGLQGEALEKAADKQSWDPSVKALVFFPSVLKYMNENLDWTQDLGDAVLGQRDDVMDAVQRLRREAEKAGTLKTTEQQRVETSGDTIIVQPADPKVVYVPSYNPSQGLRRKRPAFNGLLSGDLHDPRLCSPDHDRRPIVGDRQPGRLRGGCACGRAAHRCHRVGP